MIKRESKRIEDKQTANAFDHGAVMGKVICFGKIIPGKQKRKMCLGSMTVSIIKIQRWIRRVLQTLREQRALQQLSKLVLRHNFNECRQKFDTDYVIIDTKKEGQIKEKFQREERLSKLKHKQSRVLMFNNRTFRVDT